MASIPAITLWQPWATLVAEGLKPYEFRHWPAPARLVGQRIAIHAGARPVKKADVEDLLCRLGTVGGWGTALVVDGSRELLERVHMNPGRVPLSSVLCMAVLGKPQLAVELFGPDVADSDRIDKHVWAWPLIDIERLEPPMPARGAQGFWHWRPDSLPTAPRESDLFAEPGA